MNYLDTPTEQGGMFADLCAKIDLHIGSVNKLAETLEKQRRKPPMQPVFGRLATTGVVNAAGDPMILRFPLRGPDQGHYWYVRTIGAAGLTPTLAAAGRADVFVSAADLRSELTLAAIGLADWRDFTNTLPNMAFYGRGDLELRLNEKLFVVISNGTIGQQYAVNMSFEDFEEGAVRQEWGV